MKSWITDFFDEEAEVEYCPYCLNPRNNKMSCCHEVHFIQFKDLDHQDKLDIASQEWDMAFGDRK